MSNVGFRVFTSINRPDRQLLDSVGKFAVSNIADNMGRMFCIAAHIKPFNSARLLGCAFTVKVAPGDNLMFHKALDLAEPGDIIVVDGQGAMENALCGEIMVRYAMSRGISGFLIDGCIRDSAAIKDLDFPVYAKGVTPRGPYKNGPGEVNVPVVCGGVVVNPGDIVCGDADGIVVINPDDVPITLEKTQILYENELRAFKAIDNGSFDRSWVDKVLAEKGCEIIQK